MRVRHCACVEIIIHRFREGSIKSICKESQQKKKNHREAAAEEKSSRTLCVLVWGQRRGSPSPVNPPLASARSLWGSLGFWGKHLSLRHPWTQRWAVYLGPTAWQLYWCYIQAHGDPDSENGAGAQGEEEEEKKSKAGEWRSEEEGGWSGGEMALAEVKK